MADIKRKLATIRTIKSVEPIPNADSIVKLTFESMGWVCVTDKATNPQPGDKRVYFEVDSVLPKDTPWKDANGDSIFKFMEPYNYRVKTIKLRGQVSQGLSIPLADFPGLIDRAEGDNSPIEEGLDVTDSIGVVKYELPVDTQIGGDTKGPFPGFIEKTDELRAAEFDNLNEILATKDLTATVKVDGSSGTFYFLNGEFGVCSRNQELKDTEKNAFWIMARKYKLQERMKALGMNLAIQGEVAGPGIQNNRAKLPELRLFVFTVQDLDKNRRLTPQELHETLSLLNSVVEGEQIGTVPELPMIPAGTLKTIEDVDALAEGPTTIVGAPETRREGVVFRSTDGTISFKQVSTKYLLKHDL